MDTASAPQGYLDAAARRQRQPSHPDVAAAAHRASGVRRPDHLGMAWAMLLIATPHSLRRLRPALRERGTEGARRKRHPREVLERAGHASEPTSRRPRPPSLAPFSMLAAYASWEASDGRTGQRRVLTRRKRHRRLGARRRRSGKAALCGAGGCTSSPWWRPQLGCWRWQQRRSQTIRRRSQHQNRHRRHRSLRSAEISPCRLDLSVRRHRRPLIAELEIRPALVRACGRGQQARTRRRDAGVRPRKHAGR
jgi:hypothetical protein